MSERELVANDIHEFLARHQRKDLLRFITAGSVDDGKSTLIGRLLFDADLVFDDQLEALERDSQRQGNAGAGNIDFALLVDGLGAEREQGITIDVAYRYFATERRKFILADSPGHEQYTRNMATGASTADLAVILIDARTGVLPQTKRHSFIASLLGINHVVVAVNKMDLVDYSEDVFEEIRAAYTEFAAKLQVSDVHFIPMSALKGENVVRRAETMEWYQGSPLLDYLETVHIASDRNLIDLRFPVQYVIRPDQSFRGYAGSVSSGVLRTGDDVVALPSGRRSRVKSIVTWDGEIDEAVPPMSVTVTLEDDIDVSRGDMLVHPGNVPRHEQIFESMVVWMDEEPLRPGASYLVKHASGTVQASVAELRYKINVGTLHREPAQQLDLNEIGRLVVTTSRPLHFDAYRRNRPNGAFILIDRLTNRTVGAGMIRDVAAGAPQDDEGSDRVELVEHESSVSVTERAERLGQSPFTVWLTGLPRSGKSTIAYRLERMLFDRGHHVHVIDGSNMRRHMSPDLTFSGVDRSENNRRAAEAARMTCDLGMITITALVSPFEADRLAARHLIGENRFVEVFCSAPLEVCEDRDETGLYRKAREGTLRHVTGVSAPYEAPSSADVVLDTAARTVDECCSEVIDALIERGLIRR